MDITTIAQAGLTSALARFESSATRMARAGNPDADVDIASEIVEQIQSKVAVEANISVLKTANEMLGKLLDIKV